MPRPKDDVLRTGTVTVEEGDRVYTAEYAETQGGRTTQLGGMTEEQASPDAAP